MVNCLLCLLVALFTWIGGDLILFCWIGCYVLLVV